MVDQSRPPALPYRAGDYSNFLARMLSGLDRQVIPDGPNQGSSPLKGLSIETADDFIIALLQGWATVGDVLSFYQERIASECYLETATEVRSVLELAQGIGYRPSPGLAASTYLAFTVADVPGAPERAAVPQGTPVQSVPTQDGQLPQTFETSYEVEARAAWNQLRPQVPLKMQRQEVSGSANRLRLKGLATALNPGDSILIIGEEDDRSEEGRPWFFRTLKSVDPDPQKGYTLVTWEPVPVYGSSRQPLINPRVYVLRRRLTLFGHDAPNWEDAPENIRLRYSPRRGGLLFSANRGGDWQALSASLPEQPTRALAINQQGDIFAGVVSAGVFRSTDSGGSWEQINTGLTNLDVNALVVDEKGYLLAGTANGVFRSTDNGNQWEMIRGEFRLRRLPFLSPINTELPPTATRSLVGFTDPEEERSYILAGTDRGIFRSVNGSNGWQPVNSGLPKRDDRTGYARVAVFALAADAPSRQVFAGTDYGVFRSTNNGESWKPANSGLPNTDSDTGLTTTAIHALLALAQPAGPQSQGFSVAANEETDSGSLTSWLKAGSEIVEPLSGIFSRLGLFKDPGPQPHLFAGTDQGVFCSRDNGESWRPANQGLPDTNPDTGITSTRIRHLAAGVDPESQRTYLYAGADKGVFRSEDNGESWSEITPDLEEQSVYSLAPGPQGGLALATPVTGVAGPDWPEFHASASCLDIDLSQPGVLPGSWVVLRQPRQESAPLLRLYQARHVAIVPREDFGLSGMVTRVEVGPDDSLPAFDLRLTEVFAQSEPMELFSEQVPHLEPLYGNEIRLTGLVPDLKPGQAISVTGSRMRAGIGDLGGVFRLDDSGWQPVGLTNQDIRAVAVNREGEVFVATRNGGVFLYSETRSRWRAKNTHLTTLDVRALALNSSGWIFAGASGGGVFRSSDHGDYWTQISSGLTNLDIRALAVNASDWIFAGAKGGGVFRSTDDGNSWTPVSAGLDTPDVRALAVDFSSQVYAGTKGGGIFRSANNGDTWISVNTGLTNLDVRALTVDAEGNVIAGTAGGGVFFLPPGGDGWKAMNDSLDVKDVRSLAVSPGGEILAGTRGGGVFRCAGVQVRWEHLETGLSNDVRALASARTFRGDRTVAGARNVAVLTSPDGLESVELRQRFLFSVGPQAASDLDQGSVPKQLAAGLEDRGASLSKDALVAVVEEGAAWVIEDPGANQFLVRSERGSINVYQPVIPLWVIAAPSLVDADSGMMQWHLMDQLGFSGFITARADEISLVPPSTQTTRVSEIAHIQGSNLLADQGYTSIALVAPLQYVYDPRTVTICANVVHATHGKTVPQEVVGSGRGDQEYQSFVLSHSPVTYVAALTPGEVRSTLSVRVVSEPQQGILPGVPFIQASIEEGASWQEAQSLIGSDGSSQHYITRTDENGRTRVIFGDGRRGARLPTGVENVVATYRYGIGPEGEVAANSLTLLQQQPLGISSVTNPVPATGAAAGEPIDTARVKAPVSVRALGRIVSLRDYEDFIYGLPGVGKVQVKSLWNGRTHLAHITVAAAGGAPIKRGSALYDSIVQLIQAHRASRHHEVVVDPADLLHFNLAATVFLGPGYKADEVEALVNEVLKQTFSFENREFGEGVAASDITSLVQRVPGVQHVDLEAFYTLGSSISLQPYLSAYPATWGWVNHAALPAQLMLINGKDGINLTLKAVA